MAGDSNRNAKAMGVEKYSIKLKNFVNEIVMKRVSIVMSRGGKTKINAKKKTVLKIIGIDNL